MAPAIGLAEWNVMKCDGDQPRGRYPLATLSLRARSILIFKSLINVCSQEWPHAYDGWSLMRHVWRHDWGLLNYKFMWNTGVTIQKIKILAIHCISGASPDCYFWICSLERCTRITVIASGSSMCVSITMVLATQSPCFTIMSLLRCCSTCVISTSTVTSTEYWNFHLYWLCYLWWAERQRDWHYQRGVCAEYGLNSLLGSCRGYWCRSRGQVSFV